jgi:hemerythrin
MRGHDNMEETIITWSESYATGIKLIDDQHKELVNLTNRLYQACMTHQEEAFAFKEAMHSMVDYVHFHFDAELKLLERINFPDFLGHKQQHDSLVRDIIEAVKDYESGKKAVPYAFVRTLKDWVFGHIAIYDKIYAAYVDDQKTKGHLNDGHLQG